MARPRTSVTLIAVMSMLALAACQGGTQTQAPQSSGSLELITPGTLVIGYAPDPSVIDVVSGKVVGPYGHAIDEVAKMLGLTPHYVSFQFPGLVPALLARRIDVIGAGFTITQKRAQVIYFDPPQFFGADLLATLPGPEHAIHSWEEAKAKGLILASVKGYLQIDAWQQLGIKYHAFDNQDGCVQDVLHGGAAGCTIGEQEFLYTQAHDPTNPEAKLAIYPMQGPLTALAFDAFGVSKDHPNLARVIGQAMNVLWRSGSIRAGYVPSYPGVDWQLMTHVPQSQPFYINGPWEAGVTPPPFSNFPNVNTVKSGQLTVGILADSPMLKASSSPPSGPEADILSFVAQKMGLKLAFQQVTNESTALQNKQVDVVAGDMPITADRVANEWMTLPIAFSPDYMYVKSGTAAAQYHSWEDVARAHGIIAVASQYPRIGQIQQSGATVKQYPSAALALGAVASGSAAAFVGTTVDYVDAANSTPSIASARINWVQNSDSFTQGQALAWAVRQKNGVLLDELNRGITMAWQQNTIKNAYASAWALSGVNLSLLETPGPPAAGSTGLNQEFKWVDMLITGPWDQDCSGSSADCLGLAATQ